MREELRRRACAALSAFVLVLSQVLSVATMAPTTAVAATRDSATIASVTAYPSWVGMAEHGVTSHYMTDSDGVDMYCADPDLGTPHAGQTFWGSTPGGLTLDYILYHGYGGQGYSGSVQGYTGIEAEAVTQIAVWLATYGTGPFMGRRLADAGRAFYDEARANASSSAVYAGTSLIYGQRTDVQRVVGQTVRTGGIDLRKSSSNPALTDGNGCYSLEGAVYGVYSDEGCTSLVAELATDSGGSAHVDGLALGTYWVKETTAAKGYALDDEVYQVSVSGSADAWLDVTDEPLSDPVNFIVQKVDAEGNASVGYDAQGNATVEGAQFTVRFYEGLYDSVEGLPGQADRTWVIESKLVGSKVRAFLTDDYKVSGDPWYSVDGTGAAVLPLGTFTVQETKAPEGYLLSDGSVHIGQVVEDPDAYYGVSIKKIGSWSNKFDQEDAGAGLAVEDEVIRGGVRVPKIDHELEEGTAQGGATLAGAVLSVKNASEAAVNVNGRRVEPGQEALTMTTGEDGTAKTAADALPYGTYTVTEKAAPEGYLLNTAWSVTFSVQKDGAIVDLADAPLAEDVVRGGVSLAKIDRDLKLGQAQGDATLEGAEFSITSRSEGPVMVGGVVYQRGDVVATLKTAADGTVTSPADLLPYGAYTVRETRAPEGYLANDGWSRDFEVSKNGEVVDLRDGPADDPVMRGGISVRKVDSDWGTSDPQGDATLDGAEWTVYNRSGAAVVVDGRAVQPGEAACVIAYEGSPDDEGASRGVATTGEGRLPYGTYEVRETKAPDGYLLNEEWSRTVEIRSDGQMVDLTSSDDATADDVIRGGVRLRKADAQLLMERHGLAGELADEIADIKDGMVNGSAGASPSEAPAGAAGVGAGEPNDAIDATKPLGGATLRGAVIGIANASDNPVVVDGRTYGPGEVVKHVETDEGGIASTPDDCLPYGSYVAYEETPPAGYLPNREWSATFEIAEDGQMVDLTDDAAAVADLVARGDIKGQKHDEESQERMADVPFLVTSRTTGESHVIVTDENGMFDTTGSWNPHTQRTNANDEALREDGTVDESKLDPTAGVWFSGTQDATELTPMDDLGAMPYDTYEIQELRCSANEGYMLVHTDVTITRDNVTLDLGTFDDRPEPDTSVAIATELTGMGSHSVPAADSVTLTDEVRYQNLEIGHGYRLEAELRAFDGDGRDLGVVATGEAEFAPKLASDSEVVALTVDTSDLMGARLVCAERLYDADELIAEHADWLDEDQTVHVPSIETTLVSGATGGHEGPSYGVADYTDTVHLTGLVTGERYTATGTLHVRDAEGNDAGPARDEHGNPVTASVDFTATSESMDVEITFEGVDAALLAGQTVVGFEELSGEHGTLVAHADIADEDQSVHLPGVATQAVNDETGDQQSPSEGEQVLVDTVSLSNLTVGSSYTLRSSAHAKDVAADGTAADGGVLPAEDGDATAETTFVADAAEMVVTVEVPYDASALEGRDTVCFEELYDGSDVLIARHADIDDAFQTLFVPSVHTTATSAATGTHVVPAATGQVVHDVVEATNLIVGKEYTISGEVHRILVDGEGNRADGGVLADAEGNPVVASKTFVADATDMEVTLEFVVDADLIAGSSANCFEELSSDGTKLAVHADVNDEGQTFTVPAIQTTLTSDATSGHEGASWGIGDYTDTVSLTGLVPGEIYALEGELRVRDADGNDAGPARNGQGDPVTAKVDFTADRPDMQVDVAFEDVDSRLAAGQTLVAYETLTGAAGTLATHADIADEGQSVHLPAVATEAANDETGTQQSPNEGEQVLVDTVSLTNLTDGHAYTLKSSVHAKSVTEDGTAADGGILSAADGQATAETQFVAHGSDMVVTVEVPYDAAGLDGRDTVCFEELYDASGVMVARHADIDDAFQTLYVPSVHTTATSEATGSHVLPAEPDQVVTDLVKASNLIVGKTYTVSGEVHRIDVDDAGNRADGGVLNDADGLPITASKTFVATDADMEVTLEFVVDADLIAGSSANCFETLASDDVALAVHADVNDEDQTVHVPRIGTTATDAADGDKEIVADRGARITDVVAYENLVPGETYELAGQLRRKVIDGSGNAVDDGPATDASGNAVTATTTFTAEEASGTAVVTFAFDATGLDGKTLVVYEDLTRNGVEVAAHADIADEAQAVFVAEKPGKPWSNTGQAPMAALLVTAGCALAATGAVALRRKAKSRA